MLVVGLVAVVFWVLYCNCAVWFAIVVGILLVLPVARVVWADDCFTGLKYCLRLCFSVVSCTLIVTICV